MSDAHLLGDGAGGGDVADGDGEIVEHLSGVVRRYDDGEIDELAARRCEDGEVGGELLGGRRHRNDARDQFSDTLESGNVLFVYLPSNRHR